MSDTNGNAPKRSAAQEANDEAYETLTAMFFPGAEFTTLTPKQKTDVGQAVRIMRGGPVKANSSWDSATAPPAPSAEEIRRRADEYRMRWPDPGSFTLRALATHWGELGGSNGDAVALDANPIIDAIIDVFRMERPADGKWPLGIAQRLRSAAAVFATTPDCDAAEISRRAAEFRRRFPRRDFTIDALADRWFELTAPLDRVSADRTVSDYRGWQPSYDTGADLFDTEPAAEQAPEPEGFDLHRWHAREVMNERRSIAFRMLETTRPWWAAEATPAALAKADPKYAPELLAGIKGWVRRPTAFLTLFGPTGTGKTFIACAIAYRFADLGRIPMFLRYSDLMTQIRFEWNSPAGDDSILKRAGGAGLLILDDLGATGDIRDWELNYFDTLLNGRLDRGLPTIVTTNLMSAQPDGDDLTLGGGGDLESHVGKRFASRLRLGTILPVGGIDRRLRPPLSA